MGSDDALALYLNDHLAGAAAGVELARRISENLGGVLDDVVAGIEEDRVFLDELIQAFGFREHAVKQAVSSFLEKVGQLKLNRVVSGSEELARMLEMEALSMGIQGKRDLWEALLVLAPFVPELAGHDFEALVGRADDQQARLREHRLAAAAAAFSESASRTAS